jgi:hypothetical protein
MDRFVSRCQKQSKRATGRLPNNQGSAGMEETAQVLGMILGGLFTWSLVLNALAF